MGSSPARAPLSPVEAVVGEQRPQHNATRRRLAHRGADQHAQPLLVRKREAAKVGPVCRQRPLGALACGVRVCRGRGGAW